jgi:hypothetical protein
VLGSVVRSCVQFCHTVSSLNMIKLIAQTYLVFLFLQMLPGYSTVALWSAM